MFLKAVCLKAKGVCRFPLLPRCHADSLFIDFIIEFIIKVRVATNDYFHSGFIF